MIRNKITALLLIFTILVSIFALSSCHGSQKRDAFEVPEEFDSEAPITISFWAKNDTNKDQVAVYNKAIEDFMSIYPNITVNLVLYTDYGRIYNDVITNIATGTTPNVCITYPDHIATYMTGENVVVPLSSLMQDEKYGLGGSEVKFDSVKQDEIIEKFLDECYINGNYYALPYLRSTEACYINKTYVEKLGYTIPDVLTWDWIFEVSEAALEKNEDGTYKVNGQKTLIPFIYKSTDNMMIQMLEQKDAGYSDESGNVLIFNEDTEQILKTLASHAKTKAFSTFKISSYPANFLNAGQCIFAIDSTAGSSWMGSKAPLADIHENQKVDFETVVKIIPQYDTENPKMISQGPSICIFNKENTQEVLASWLFMQFMLTNEVQIGYSKTEGYIPVTTKAQNSEEYTDYLSRSGEDNGVHYKIKLDATKLLLDNVDNTFVTPVFNGSASLRNAAGQMIEEVAKATRRNKTVDDTFIKNLFSEMTALYKLDEIQKNDPSRLKLGALPMGSVVLISSLGIAWVSIGAYSLNGFIKKKKLQQKS